MTFEDLPTPAILIDAAKVRRNVQRLAEYAKQQGLKLRPHTKTHKSQLLGGMQMEHGAVGLTVAKVGEAHVMAGVADDVLMAYPAVDPGRCAELAKLARTKTVRVAIDSPTAADSLSHAAREAGVTIGILVDLDVGLHRTGVQTAKEALALAQYVPGMPNLRLDGIMFYPGHIGGPGTVDGQWMREPAKASVDPEGLERQGEKLREVDALLGETIDLWKRHGLEAGIVSGGSTPTAYQSHLVTRMTEFRPGTYVFQDMNGVRGGFAAIDDCAARIVATVVSTAVPGQFVVDAGTKTLTSDRCGPAPDSGHGFVVEYPEAKITKLTEEHGQADVSACGGRSPKPGDRVTIIPNHICPCVNLQNHVWWRDENGVRAIPVDARGKVF